MKSLVSLVALAAFFGLLNHVESRTIGFYGETSGSVGVQGDLGLYGGRMNSGYYGLGLQGSGGLQKQLAGGLGIEGINGEGEAFDWGLQGGAATAERFGGNIELEGGPRNSGGWGFGLRGRGNANANSRVFGRASANGNPFA